MSDYISRIFNYITELFIKGKYHPKRIKERPSRYSTPLRPSSRMSDDSHKNTDARGKRLNSFPVSLPSRLPKTFPLIRTPSQISMHRFAPEVGTPFRPNTSVRKQGSSSNLKTGRTKTFDFSFPEGTNLIRKDTIPEMHHVNAQNDSHSSLEFHSMDEDRLDMTVHTPEFCENCDKCLPQRLLHTRKGPCSVPAFPSKCKNICSKIPVSNQVRCAMSSRPTEMLKFPKRHCGVHTLPSARRMSNGISGFREKEDVGDNPCVKSFEIGNWIAYRNDTSTKFERVFKFLSKKKHTIGNVIDSASHAQWMFLSGISVDKDAFMFKQFAGGKVVLTFGEYKFLIDKICSAHDLDYWDVLRKMATFQDEELNYEALLTPQ